MKKVEITREQVEAIYAEVERRIESDVRDGAFENQDEINEYRKAMFQGLYSALIVLSNNWSEVVTRMIDPVEEDLYWKRLGYED